jgi:acetyl esterase
MAGILTRMARIKTPPMHAISPQQARAQYAAGAGILDIAAQPIARVENFQLPARDGQLLAARLYAPSHDPKQQPLPVLLYFHGGGFTIGSIDTHDALCRTLCHRAGCAVVSLDYRLAPEHRFPVAVNDCWDALLWLSNQGETLGFDSTRLAVAGDSAGGTLAAVCAILARDAGLALAFQLLFYPGTAARQDTPSHRTFAKGFVLEEAHINYLFDQYIDPSDRDDWRFAPLNAPDLQGVAPAWLGLAECDPLVDEGIMYADQLRLAGVAVDLEIYRGVVHEFIKMGRLVPQALTAHEDAAKFIKISFKIN